MTFSKGSLAGWSWQSVIGTDIWGLLRPVSCFMVWFGLDAGVAFHLSGRSDWVARLLLITGDAQQGLFPEEFGDRDEHFENTQEAFDTADGGCDCRVVCGFVGFGIRGFAAPEELGWFPADQERFGADV